MSQTSGDEERARILSGALDRLGGGPPTATDAAGGSGEGVTTASAPTAVPPAPLRWCDTRYGARWTRTGEPEPVDVLGKPIPPQAVGVGWTLFSLTQMTTEGQQRSGVVVETATRPTGGDYETLVFICADNYRASVRRVDIDVDDVAEAVPPSRPALDAMCRSIWRQLGDGQRRGSRTDRAWLEQAAHRLAALAAN